MKTIAYDHQSRRASAVTMPGASQTVTTLGYEPDNDLRYLTHNYPGATVDLKYTHTYSASGRVLTSSASETLNRYAPPAVHGTQNYASANSLNQYPSVTPIGGAAQIFAHDLNGNLTSDGATTFSYDATNRLLSIAGAGSASYGYDALDPPSPAVLAGIEPFWRRGFGGHAAVSLKLWERPSRAFCTRVVMRLPIILRQECCCAVMCRGPARMNAWR